MTDKGQPVTQADGASGGSVDSQHLRAAAWFIVRSIKAEFTAIIEPAPEGGYWAVCPEIPGANGQGETIEETKDSLR